MLLTFIVADTTLSLLWILNSNLDPILMSGSYLCDEIKDIKKKKSLLLYEYYSHLNMKFLFAYVRKSNNYISDLNPVKCFQPTPEFASFVSWSAWLMNSHLDSSNISFSTLSFFYCVITRNSTSAGIFFIYFIFYIIFAPNASLFVFTLCLALAAQNGARRSLTSHCGAGGTSFVLTLNEKPLIEIKADLSRAKNAKAKALLCSRLIRVL